MKQYEDVIKTYNRLIGFYEGETSFTKYMTQLSTIYNSIAWEMISNKEFKQAILVLNKSIQLDTKNLFPKGNLAHAYLLTNEFEKAKKIYLKYQNQKMDDKLMWEKAVSDDFKLFKEDNITHPDMEKIEELLGIK